MEHIANEQLFRILIKNGFIETTSKRDKLKGKKSFKLTKHARREIYFDYFNIKIFDSIHVLEKKLYLSDQDLQNLIFYFKLNSADKRELIPSGYFNFDEIQKSIEIIENEKMRSREFGMKISRKIKLKRILEVYESVIL
jgi:hypothetical protein